MMDRTGVEREMDEEMRTHIEMEIEDRVASGMNPEEARRTALRDFGAVERFKEEGRAARGIGWIEAFRQDIRFTVRSLAKSPGFALAAVLTLGLGIGATTAIFSVVEGVLLRPLPFPEPDRLVRVYQVSEDGGQSSFSHPNFADVRERTRSFAALAEHSAWVNPVSINGDARRMGVAAVSEEFFRVVGVQPAIGRGFLADEWAAPAPVALVSHEYWSSALEGSPDLGSAPLRIGADPVTVVGVMPEGFGYPGDSDIWIPQGPQDGTSRTAHNWAVTGRLRAGVSAEAAEGELAAIARDLKPLYGDDTNMSSVALTPLHANIVGPVRPALLVLLGASMLLLVIACANVVSLLLARAAGRRRELAVRLALGAGRSRLARQFLTESLVLSVAGGALGIALAWAGVRVLVALDPGRVPRLEQAGVSGWVLLFVAGVSFACAATLGLITAVRASGGDVREALTDGSRTQSGGAASQRVRAALTTLQIALTVVLLLGAGLVGRSFLRLMTLDPGFRTDGALVVDVVIPGSDDEAEKARLLRLQDQVIAAMAAAPGVDAVGSVDVLPLSDYGSNGTFLVVNSPDEVTDFEGWRTLANNPARAGNADYRVATEGYFRAMDIPLIRGRLPDSGDDIDAPPVAVVSERLAREWPGGEDPIGKLVQYGNMDGDLRAFTVVGVVGDVRERGLDTDPTAAFYGNARQRPNSIAGGLNFVASGDSDVGAVAAIARRTVRSLDPALPMRVRTIEEVFSASLANRRFSLVLLGAFAAAALVLAVTGIYGVVSYLVAQRTREIGIRLALGAPGARVLRMVVGRGLLLALAGVALGVLAALATTRLIAGLLFEVGTRDLLTFTAVPLVITVVAALASWLPARRASRVDPVVAMRAE